jgi:ABC-type transport system involved in multi-copper enzyme maturation permease subunit
MPLGPVFNAELLTTARRPRYYIIRVLYGLIILFTIYLTYQSNVWRFGGDSRQLSIQEMANFGLILFTTFATVQFVTVLLLTPSLVGGAIADEKQRKTLHYLLTSQLSGAEIVLGKLAARLLHVFVLVALGLPVVSLLTLIGGIQPQVVLFSYAGTCTTIYFLATFSILVSVFARRPREAISLLYIMELFWLIAPTLLIHFMPTWAWPWPTIASWINPALEYVALTSPYFLTTPLGWGYKGGMMGAGLWGMGLQILYGTLFIVLAAVRLRPAYRNSEAGAGRGWAGKLAKLGSKRRWLSRPECGDDAMLWKEMYVSRTAGLTKAALVVLAVAMVGCIAYSSYYLLEPAIQEIRKDGYFQYGDGRRDFNYFLRGVGTAIYLLWFLGIASSSSGALSSEREEDQWTSLLTTPLTGREILRAKMIGPVWGLRYVAYLLFLLWAIGLAVGSIHPLGLMACLVEFVVFTWFLVALGTSFSLRAKNSTRALASTMALLIFLNGGYLFCCIPLRINSMAIGAGSTPYIFTISLLSMQDMVDMWRGYQVGETIAGCILGVIFYAIAAAGLTAWLFASFDIIVDRPDRFRQKKTANQRREFLEGPIAKGIAFIDDFH